MRALHSGQICNLSIVFLLPRCWLVGWETAVDSRIAVGVIVFVVVVDARVYPKDKPSCASCGVGPNLGVYVQHKGFGLSTTTSTTSQARTLDSTLPAPVQALETKS